MTAGKTMPAQTTVRAEASTARSGCGPRIASGRGEDDEEEHDRPEREQQPAQVRKLKGFGAFRIEDGLVVAAAAEQGRGGRRKPPGAAPRHGRDAPAGSAARPER